jgi:tripartite-type tricarboxylate transporter receptor subunit TctC
MKRRTLLLPGLLACVIPASLPRAQGSSGKPVRLVVPFTPGGSTDILARVIANRLGTATAQTYIVDNKPGAGGSVGADSVARAEADGSTLLMGHIGTLAVNVSLYPKLPYDPIKSFTPIAWVARVPNVLVVNANSSIHSLKDLITQAQAKPGRLTYSSGGNGSAAHIAFEYLKLRTKIFMSHIPYRGTAPSITDLISGQIDATFTGGPAVMPHVKSGRLRVLAVSSSRRMAAFPDAPTVAESGYPGFEADQWYGVVAPAGLPPELVMRLNLAINKILVLPEVAQQLASEGAEPVQATPQAFAELIAHEIPRWREVIRAGNVKAE